MEEIKNAILNNISQRLTQSGIMFRIFGRAKSVRSLKHKMAIKGEKYRSGKGKIQDMIGLRIVLYFTDDMEALEMFFSEERLVDRAVDDLDTMTFRPQRLNLVRQLPQNLIESFRAALPAEYAPYIDDTYEIQIRTVFSEGWHEVEHDMRYKCKEDWVGCDNYSRQLNGVLATLETAQWSMGAVFREMAEHNLREGRYNAMLRNKLMLRLADDGFSPQIMDYLNAHEDIAQALKDSDRVVLLLTLLHHDKAILLTYDNVLFLINRFDIMDSGIRALESQETTQMLDDFIAGK